MEEMKMSHQEEQKIRRKMRNWRFLAVIVTAALLPVALIAIILTAPISELHIGIRNVDEVDTMHVLFYLDDSPKASLYAGPGGSAGLTFHVSPGMHTVGVDFLFNYSHDNAHDEIVDIVWTVKVGFNSVHYSRLMADKDGIGGDLIEIMYLTDSPLEQAINDPYVMVPAATLAALHVLLVAAIWNYCRTPPGKESS